MNIEFYCSQCGQLLAIDSKYAGVPVQCPKCNADVKVPEAIPDEPVGSENMVSYRNIEVQRVDVPQKGKAKYIIDGYECFAEQAAIRHYESLGYATLCTENVYWWTLMCLFFWHVIFARIRGSVVIINGVETEVDPSDERFEQLFEQSIQVNGMPFDFFSPEFYERRKKLVDNRIQELQHSNLKQVLGKSYEENYGKNCRPIEDWNRYKIDELMISVQKMDKEALIKILERLIFNFNDNRAGLPDLIVYDDKAFFFSEVKSEKDKISDKQRDWHSFISETLGLKVEICLINHTEAEIKRIKASHAPVSKEVVVSFGFSSSKKREEAIRFVQEQRSYFTQGEGKEQIHGAKFRIIDIEKLSKILDLTSGWKTQKIEIDGKIIKSAELRDSLWCFQEKNKLHASSDYCKRSAYENKLNKFGCRNMHLNEFENDRWQDYGYVDTARGVWIFNREKINRRIEEEINRLKYCPILDPKKALKFAKKLPEEIDPKTDRNWAFISNDYRKWFWHENAWLNTLGETNFTGFSVMIAVEPLTRKEAKEALRFSKANAFYEKHARKSERKPGCFIATAVYGDSGAYQVRTLRSFRDKHLENRTLGELFIRIYYRISPSIARYIEKHQLLVGLAKRILDRIIKIIIVDK